MMEGIVKVRSDGRNGEKERVMEEIVKRKE